MLSKAGGESWASSATPSYPTHIQKGFADVSFSLLLLPRNVIVIKAGSHCTPNKRTENSWTKSLLEIAVH